VSYLFVTNWTESNVKLAEPIRDEEYAIEASDTLTEEVLKRAATVAARCAAMAEAGDVVAAVERGLVSEANLLEIGTFDAGWAESRDPQAITVFKSVGLAIQDVAAAELIVRRAGVTQESVAEARE